MRTFCYVLLILITITGCSKETEGPIAPPPELSFILNLSFFNGLLKSTPQKENILPGEAFKQASLVTGFWKIVLDDILYVPLMAYQQAGKSKPYRTSANSWSWQYILTDEQFTYDITFVGEIKEQMIEWKLYASKPLAYNHFLWMEGVCNQKQTVGNWIIYQENPLKITRILEIDWEYNEESGASDLLYTYVKENDTAYGNTIEFSHLEEGLYDMSYKVFQAMENQQWGIYLNSQTKTGSIFQADIRQCWNSSFEDMICP